MLYVYHYTALVHSQGVEHRIDGIYSINRPIVDGQTYRDFKWAVIKEFIKETGMEVEKSTFTSLTLLHEKTQ